MAADPLSRYLAGELPAPVALMQLIQQSSSPSDLAARLSRPVMAVEAVRLAELRAFAERHPGAFALIRRVLDCADHALAGQATPSAWAAVFDAIGHESPSAASALYALGDEDLLDATSAELVNLLMRDGYLNQGAVVADIGCGMGRLIPRLAEAAHFVIGLDISEVMLAEARRRLPAARAGLVRVSGAVLPLRTGSVDLALAIDVMPYVPADIVTRRLGMQEVARIVRTGGTEVIMNWSYSGRPVEHCREIAGAIDGLPLRLVRNGDRPFSLWDGAVFVLARL